MAFNLVLTTEFQKDYEESLEYIITHFQDYFAARSLEKAVDKALSLLEKNATSFDFVNENRFRSAGYRKIHLKKYHYKIVYRIDGDTVFVEALFHDLQDYENLLSS